jgi:eukaryotic-like serine/threonine-protein kinase
MWDMKEMKNMTRRRIIGMAGVGILTVGIGFSIVKLFTATPLNPFVAANIPPADTSKPDMMVRSEIVSGVDRPPTDAISGVGWISPRDGMALMDIPAGEFLMGSEDGDADEHPLHKVFLDRYWMDRTEVTNEMFAKCVDAGKCIKPKEVKSSTRAMYYGDKQYINYPVIYVDWTQAKSYCEWADRRLPTEAEWEKGARGTDGRKYPWGNYSPATMLANFSDSINDTAETGRFPGGVSPYGLLDMAGNVWEWVADRYDEEYYASSPYQNPRGPSTGNGRVQNGRVLRGGSWGYDQRFLRVANRGRVDSDLTSNHFIGFRCVR